MSSHYGFQVSKPVADPEFPVVGGANSPKSCMSETKESGHQDPWGGAAHWLRSLVSTNENMPN